VLIRWDALKNYFSENESGEKFDELFSITTKIKLELLQIYLKKINQLVTTFESNSV